MIFNKSHNKNGAKPAPQKKYLTQVPRQRPRNAKIENAKTRNTIVDYFLSGLSVDAICRETGFTSTQVEYAIRLRMIYQSKGVNTADYDFDEPDVPLVRSSIARANC